MPLRGLRRTRQADDGNLRDGMALGPRPVGAPAGAGVAYVAGDDTAEEDDDDGDDDDDDAAGGPQLDWSVAWLAWHQADWGS